MTAYWTVLILSLLTLITGITIAVWNRLHRESISIYCVAQIFLLGTVLLSIVGIVLAGRL